MKKIFITIIALSLSIVALTAQTKNRQDGTKTLSTHETEAVYKGTTKVPCRFRTAQCPNRCNHGGEYATFEITKYTKYDKPGKYGDKKQKKFMTKLANLDAATKATLKTLKVGDQVNLNWKHNYVTKNRSSYPVRVITKLEKKVATK